MSLEEKIDELTQKLDVVTSFQAKAEEDMDVRNMQNLREYYLKRQNGELLWIKDVEEMYKISKSQIHKLTSLHKIPHYKHGGATSKVYFKRSEIEEFLFSKPNKQFLN